MSAAASATLSVQVRFPEAGILPISMVVNANVCDLARHLEMRPELFLPSTLGLSAPYPQVLKVFLLEVVGTTAQEIPPATLLSCLPQTAITAQAAFGSVPYGLFRTVEPTQVEPAEDARHSNPFTSKSPLFCASFGKEELASMSLTVNFAVMAGRKASVCGISTFLPDSSPHGKNTFTKTLRAPLDPLEAGYSYILPTSLSRPDVQGDPFGYLRTSDFYRRDPFGYAYYLTKRLAEESFPGPPLVKKKRDGYFCFKLNANTNLTAYGLAIVFDNNGASGHHTLIPLNVPSSTQVRERRIDGVQYQFFFNNTANGPETAAREFQLCCFKIAASAGIFDLAEYPPDDPRSDVVRVASLLFDQCSSSGILHEELDLALEELQACKFDLKILSQESAYVLKMAVHRLEECYESSSEIREFCANVLKFEEQPILHVAVFRSRNPPADETKIIEMYTEVIKENCRGLFGSETPSIFAEASIDCVLLLDDFESKERFQALLESSETCSFHVGPYEYVLQKEESKLSKVRYVDEDEETGHVVFECEVYDGQGYSHVVRATSLCTTVGQPSLKHYVAVFRAANRQ